MTAKRFAAAFAEDGTFADALSYRLVVTGAAITALLGDAAQGRPSAPIIATHPQIDWATPRCGTSLRINASAATPPASGPS